MKIFKILLCAAFIFVISACGGKKGDPYDVPDEDNLPQKGDIGDPCMKNGDCKEGLFCKDKVCSEPSGQDDSDTDDDSDTEPADDSDTDTSVPDTEPADDSDTDTNVPDEDKDTDDGSDSLPDEDADTEPVYIPECGNGLRDPGEECDNGLENSDEPGILGITCRTNCYLARCGDNILDSGELCDDGNFAAGDYCSPDCNMITGYCGDGTVQNNEACDSALDPYCAADCSAVTGYCGDGIKQSNETCDNADPEVGEHEGIGPYYCNVSCTKIIGGCGDGTIQLNEKCDDGDNNGRYGYCASDCSGPGERCGDGIKQINETCDDGNTVNGDYCSADCQTSYGSCGDGIVQSFEACDKSTSGDGIGAYCSNDCKQIIGSCGDGTINGNEECDDGVGLNGRTECDYGSVMGCEVCSLNCRKTAGIPRYCGDGVISTLAGEVCDKANFGNGTGKYCSDDCKTVVGSCGDGIIQSFEACDKALTGDGIGNSCSDDCKQIVGHCGDGTVQTNEECDLGNNNGNLNCAYGETSCTVCTASCKNATGNTFYCGDGKRDEAYGEVCDHGINNDHYGYCKSDCSGLGEHCGDNQINGNEECDNGSDNGKTECDYGPDTCTVCTTACKNAQGTAYYCGDGKINGGESCDDGELNGTYGHCDANCYGAGERCGDGEQNGSEACDDGELNGTYGHCKNDCSGLGEHCGDGVQNGSEVCDDGTNNGKYKKNAPGYCNEDCMGYGEGGYCGDEEENGSEECDFGSNNGNTDCTYGETSCTVCNSNCKQRNGNASYCGDGVISRNNGEVCDDGTYNAEYGGYCNLTCTGPSPKCGDGNTDNEFGELCDDGTNNGQYSLNEPGYCNSDCHGQGSAGYCGDGEINGYESCDSGPFNGEYGGYCNNSCNGYTPKCGDGFTDIEHGEVCDSGANNGNYGYCNSDCSAMIECGDGIKQPEEECDLGPDVNGIVVDCAYGETSCNVCSASCTIESGNTSFCGDNRVDTANNEVCDDGDNNSTYGHCNSNCNGYMPRCGDGNTDTPYGETCDDGELNGTYGHCNIGCNGTIQCGDGIINGSEYCDQGPLNGSYGKCNLTCTDIVGNCGDGIWQKENCGGATGCVEMPGGPEQCDNGYLNGATTCEYGLTSCNVCTLSCTVANGTASYCGDGTVDEVHEICDEGTANGTYGHCNNSCSGTVTWKCGDGIIDYVHGETCDDGENNGKPHYCNTTCDGRAPYCGDGKIQRENCTGYDNCEVVAGMNENCDDHYMNGEEGYCYIDCSGYCGDNTVQYAYEVCDEGTLNGSVEHCNDTCDDLTAECGNGRVEKGEFCDEGDDNGLYYGHCNATCSSTTWNGWCGDKKLQVSDSSDCGTLPLCSSTITENCCEVTSFAAGEYSETCDEGEEHNGYHGHCNATCDGLSSCGDGVVGKDEICDAYGSLTELGEDPLQCNMFAHFKSGDFSVCNANCMPIFTGCVNVDSYTSPFFETMQTRCYNNSVEITTCPTGGSFYGQEPNFSYTVHDFTFENGIAIESASSLVWQAATPVSYDECQNSTSCTKTEAAEYCENITIGGLSGWRLPTAAEFSTIMDYSIPHLYAGFTNVGSSYWTSDGVVFSTLDGTSAPAADSTLAQVKCIRDESACTSVQCRNNVSRILDFGDSMIAIYSAQGTKFVFWYFGNPKQSDTWEAALATCSGFDNNNGFNKMRLPTVNELMSLIDRENGGSLIPGFAGTAWTSTTLNSDPTQAYVVNFSTGAVTTAAKVTGSNIFVICVE